MLVSEWMNGGSEGKKREGGRGGRDGPVDLLVLKAPNGAEAVVGEESARHPVGGFDALDVVGWCVYCRRGCVCVCE